MGVLLAGRLTDHLYGHHGWSERMRRAAPEDDHKYNALAAVTLRSNESEDRVTSLDDTAIRGIAQAPFRDLRVSELGDQHCCA
jgi:hypothetical protein